MRRAHAARHARVALDVQLAVRRHCPNRAAPSRRFRARRRACASPSCCDFTNASTRSSRSCGDCARCCERTDCVIWSERRKPLCSVTTRSRRERRKPLRSGLRWRKPCRRAGTRRDGSASRCARVRLGRATRFRRQRHRRPAAQRLAPFRGSLNRRVLDTARPRNRNVVELAQTRRGSGRGATSASRPQLP